MARRTAPIDSGRGSIWVVMSGHPRTKKGELERRRKDKAERKRARRLGKRAGIRAPAPTPGAATLILNSGRPELEFHGSSLFMRDPQ
jgi:hypothetical protein